MMESDRCKLFNVDSSTCAGDVIRNPLIHIFTGSTAPPQARDDMLHYRDIGREMFETYIKQNVLNPEM